MSQGLLRIALYVLVAVLPLILSLALGPSGGNLLSNLGRGFALVGFPILAMQVLLAARIKWITRAFGFDIVIRYHRYIAGFACMLLILHPVLLAVGGYGWDLLYGGNLLVWLGRLALIMLILTVLTSVYHAPLKLKFERWRVIHDVLGVSLLVLAFIHSCRLGTSLAAVPMKALWVVFLAGAAVLFVYHRFVRPYVLARHPFEVLEVRREADKVWTVKLTPPEGQPVFDYVPGQFQFIEFIRGRGLPREEHHWTIASSPTEKGYVSSTIKELGDFTATIGETRPGDRAAVHAPFGRFSYLFHPDEEELVFIAGGIGITPLMSMLRYMRDTQASIPVTLLYGNADRASVVFFDELRDIEAGGSPPLKVVHVLSKPDEGWTGETGYIDRGRIEKYCGSDLSRKGFYVVGPPALIEKTLENLAAMGVPDPRIHIEIFSFLD